MRTGSFLVYLARCKSTGKVYVGCTRKSLCERKAEHHIAAANGSPFKFHKALKALGSAAFEWSELARPDCEAAMFAAERSFVARYNSYRDGYNSTPGGPGTTQDGMASRRKLPIKRPPYGPRRMLLRR